MKKPKGQPPYLEVSGNDALGHTLQSHHGYDHRVSVLGYSTPMRELLCGADAFVTTTAGSSIHGADPQLLAKAGS
jgi:hypothetical protein